MTERPDEGLLDTSVVVDLNVIPAEHLPTTVAICAITMAELAAGPSAATTSAERARRQEHLQRVESIFEPIPVGIEAARAHGRAHAAICAVGRTSRRRFADLLVASVALAEGIPLFTRNPADFVGLDDLIDVVAVLLGSTGTAVGYRHSTQVSS